MKKTLGLLSAVAAVSVMSVAVPPAIAASKTQKNCVTHTADLQMSFTGHVKTADEAYQAMSRDKAKAEELLKKAKLDEFTLTQQNLNIQNPRTHGRVTTEGFNYNGNATYHLKPADERVPKIVDTLNDEGLTVSVNMRSVRDRQCAQ